MMLQNILCFFMLWFIADISAKRKTEKDINIAQWNFCSCDMTEGVCDIYCCCDQDCTDFHRQVFDCENTTRSDQSHFWKCNSFKSLPGQEFEQLLCVEKENTPYIGMYFEDFPAVKDLPALHSLLNSQHKFLGEDSTPSTKSKLDKAFLNKQSIEDKGYVYGKELLVILKNSHIGRLSVPYSIYSYHCDSFYPIQYLKDSSTTCSVNVKEFCFYNDSTSLLDIRHFLIDADKKLLGSAGDDTPLENIKVTFYFYEYPCCYSKNCGSDVSCHKKLSHSNFPILFYNETVCHNGVTEVEYLFVWHDGRIHSAAVDIVLHNVSLKDTHFITQHFSVNFRHQGNENVSTVARNKSDVSHSLIRGSYEIGNPVVGLTNETFFENDDYFDGNETFVSVPLLMWQGDSEGMCTTDDTAVKFVTNKISGCYIKPLATWNCLQLKSEVLDLQSKIFNVQGLSSGRDPNFSHFVEIERSLANANDVGASAWHLCTDIPSHMHLEVTYAKFTEIDQHPLYWIIGVRHSFTTSTWARPKSRERNLYPLYSSVKFTYASIEDERLLKDVKKFWLPTILMSQCKEEICWREMFYPLTNVFLGSENLHRLSVAKNALFLIFVLIISSWFLFKCRNYGN